MIDLLPEHLQIQNVQSMDALLHTPFAGEVNVLNWGRELRGDFGEIVAAIELEDDLNRTMYMFV